MPRDNRLFTLVLALAVCLHTVRLHICMLWLTMVLQKPAIARRAIATELLRWSDQMDGYRRRAQSIPAPRRCFDHSLTCSLQPTQTPPRSKTYWPSAATAIGRAQDPQQDSSKVLAAGHLAASKDLDRALRLERLDQSNTSNSVTTPDQISTDSAPFGTVSNTASSGDAYDSRASQSQAACGEKGVPAAVDAYPTPPISPTRRARRLYAQSGVAYEPTPQFGESQQTKVTRRQYSFHTPLLSDIESASSNETCVKWKSWPSSTDVNLQHDATGGAQENHPDSPSHVLMATPRVLARTGDSCTQRRWSAYSVESVSSTVRKSSPTTLRSRGKTNRGLLEFKAKAAGPREPLLTRKHRRVLSLNLPIRPSFSQPDSAPPTPAQPSTFIASTPRLSDDEATAAAQIDAELQYKQRHIFVGTASLHAFLEALETSSSETTTKPAVMKAFTALASKEQLMARRSSQNPDDWNLVTRITPDTLDYGYSYITLARVQLGSISLQQFLDSIPFHFHHTCHEHAPLVAVVDAFKIASHMDAVESSNSNTKARAFRTLVLSQSNPLD